MENISEYEFQSQFGTPNNQDGRRDEDSTYETGSTKTKKYQRYTADQIQALEIAFKENPHPDEKARSDICAKLGLESKRVKFWFQNRRTQAKTQVERYDYSSLKKENDKLRLENIARREAMMKPTCNYCGGPATLEDISSEEHRLLVENARIKDELRRLALFARGWTNGSLPSTSSNF